jgi:GAF domain-containing protein
VLRDVDVEWLRERPILEGVAEAAAAVCDVPMAHVSITEAGDECVVGQIGMSYESYSCGSQTGPDAMVDDQIVIVEDVADADEIDLEAFDRFFGEVRFYAGIPLFVEHTPVGALVVLDTEPGELDHVRRAALFGLVHQVESHLEIHKALEGEDEPAETLSARLTSMVAHATRLRWLEGAGSEVHAIVDDLEDEIEQARELLEAMVGEEADGAQVDLGGDGGFATGAPTQKQHSSLGYVETDVEDAER